MHTISSPHVVVGRSAPVGSHRMTVSGLSSRLTSAAAFAPASLQVRHAHRMGALRIDASSAVKFDVQGRNGLELTPAIKEYAESKIAQVIKQFDTTVGVREIQVRLSARGGASHKQHGEPAQKTEVTVLTKRGTVRAESEESSLYASMDRVSDKISAQLRKMKERENHGGVHTHHKMPGTIGDTLPAEPVDDTPLYARKGSLPQEIVRKKYFAMERMSADEAAQQLQNLDHDFFVFRAQDTGELEVVYKRRAGGFGVIAAKAE